MTKDVLRHLRDLVVAKVCESGRQGEAPLRDLLDLADEEVSDVIGLAARAEVDDLSRLFQGFSRAYDEIVRSGQTRMVLEMAFVRLARRPALLPLDELLARVGELERRLGGAPPPGPTPRGGGSGGGRPGGTAARLSGGDEVRGVPVSGGASGPSAGEALPIRTRGALALAAVPAAAPVESEGAPAPERRGALALAPARIESAGAPAPERRAEPGLAPARIERVLPSPEAGLAAWRVILERLRQSRPALASVFEHGIPIEIGAARVLVGFEPGAAFLSARASEPEALEALTREIRGHFGVPTHVALDLSAKQANGLRTVAAINAEARAVELANARAAVEGHPLVQEAMRLFGAQVREVKLPGGDG